ncbi:MAG TPA: phospho-N-acetylmuramoyl-pentapeptide-transferase [Firmicutes bacterium]|jgi:phospho-N-acetylmuramoyl-pentapeptide-transferase|nr:phospho-N-acetylmuramoyl-pentapeptide-transferase [Bacillota bacterium]HOQ24599.1 phospho-N-acetylmuramoyl-pentapeptide-transferase [Bacillota bacterium]HPT67817.1 phospho-N-acetylmuramoyl-pentapeptide-transferase [Bacillota bacterium]
MSVLGWRLLLAGLFSFLTVIVLGPATIRMLHRLKFGQSIREEGPASHLKKAGTPTMGGILILLGIVVGVVAGAGRQWGLPLLWVVFITLAYGGIGFLDDLLIIIRKKSLGLKARHKLLAQVLFAGLLGIYVVHAGVMESILVPFSDLSIPMVQPIIVFLTVLFITVGASNAVNLTDGLDGLAAGNTVIAAAAMGILAIQTGQSQLGIFSFAVAGACIGFAWFNSPPAQVFMGDTGSLALGAALAGVALLSKTPLYLGIIGGVFVAETLSVMIQVAAFRLTGRRVFRMSPLHHHFELGGWMESKVVFRFWIAGILLAILGVAGYFLG